MPAAGGQRGILATLFRQGKENPDNSADRNGL